MRKATWVGHMLAIMLIISLILTVATGGFPNIWLEETWLGCPFVAIEVGNPDVVFHWETVLLNIAIWYGFTIIVFGVAYVKFMDYWTK